MAGENPILNSPTESRPWPAWYALFTAWTRPAETTRRTAHLSLKRAFAAHLFAMILLVVVVYVANARRPDTAIAANTIEAVMATAVNLAESAYGSLRDSFEMRPWQSVLRIVLIELFVVFVAFVMAPFGARRERVRDSLRHAVRRTWLHTGVLPVMMIAGTLAQTFADPTIRRWHDAAREACAAEFPNDDPGSPRWKCAREHRFALQAQTLNFAVGAAWVVLGAWVQITLIKGVTAPRPVHEVVRAPRCRKCGYGLTAAPLDARCAECGDPISASLGDDCDAGAPWEHRHTSGRVRAAMQTYIAGVIRPRWLAARLRIVPESNDYLRLAPLPLIAVALMILPVALIVARETALEQTLFDVISVFSVAGTVIAVVALLSCGLAALIAGLVQSRTGAQNVLGGAAQLVVYMAGNLIGGAWGCGLLLALMVRYGRQIEQWLGAQGVVRTDLVFIFGWLGSCLIVVVTFVCLVTRATSALRYARR
jgi:multisubunit Na+/H+ antiporter MnhB subunit